ncbi:MAG TPA: sugar ABC transporter substrate-binding protein [Clostridia bacterium]|nr:sugar ABC transporter substrate-binding protein [Clostridia bacterium]
MKKLLTIFLSMLLVISVSGCAGSSTTTKKTTEKVNLQMWHYYNDTKSKNTIQNFCDQYNKQSKVASVKAVSLAFADFKKQLSISAAASSLPDVVMIDNCDNTAYSAMGMFSDLTSFVKTWPDYEKYYDWAKKTGQYKGKIYGIPFDGNCLGIMYNKQMFRDAGITSTPKTWDELRADAKKLTKSGVAGFIMCAAKNEEGTSQFDPWLWSAGGSEYHMTSPDSLRALTFLYNMVKDGSMPTDIINWSQSELLSQFESGKTAMMEEGSWDLDNLKTDCKFEWGCFQIPKDKYSVDVLGGENLAIVKGKNVEASFDFMKYVLKTENVVQWTKSTSQFPERSDSIEDSRFSETENWKMFKDIFKTTTRSRPVDTAYPQISSGVQLALQEALSLQKSPEQAVKDGQALIDQAVANRK